MNVVDLIAQTWFRERDQRRKASTSVQMGNQVTVNVPAGSPLPQPKTLFKANLTELGGDVFHPGAWVLSVQALKVTGGFADPRMVVLDVSFGTGGAAAKFQLTAFPGSCIQVPSAEIEVTARVEAITGNAFSLDVAAFVKPGFTSAVGRRVFAANSLLSGGVAQPIPAYSKDLMIYDEEGSAGPFYALPIGALELLSGGRTMHRFSGAQILAILNAGERIPVPGGASHFRLSGADAELPGLSVDFSVQL